MRRREFLKGTAMAASMLTCFPASLAGIEREIKPGRLERRALGQTGEKLSIIGFGGFVLNQSTPAQASEWVRMAIDADVNYFDIAPSYGNAEERLGPALEPFRKDVFLACKTTQRGSEGATKELEASLKQMRTDHFDLYQLHAVTTKEDVEAIFAPGGALEAFEAARKAGKVRFIGFSAHSVDAALALMEQHRFDTILFPVNYATWHAGNFGPQVLAKAQEKKMGILALKAMAKRPWPKDADRFARNCWYEPMTDPEEALAGLRFTLSHPVTAAVHPADFKCLELALRLAPRFTPLSPEEADAIRRQALAATPIFRHSGSGNA